MAQDSPHEFDFILYEVRNRIAHTTPQAAVALPA